MMIEDIALLNGSLGHSHNERHQCKFIVSFDVGGERARNSDSGH